MSSDHSTPDDEHAEHEQEEEHAEVDHDDEERTTIQPGRNFEEEYRVDAAEAGAFLVELGEQLQEGDELTITDEEWELPFGFGEPVELEIDYDGMGEPELEIEVEIPGRTGEDAPSVE